MNGSSFQILILLVVAVVIFIRLMRVLGTRDGHEPTLRPAATPEMTHPDLKLVEPVIEDDEYAEYDEGTRAALERARDAEPTFRLNDFLTGSKGAYELILTSFFNGNVKDVESFVDPAVFEGFVEAIAAREDAGHRVEAKFAGIRDVSLRSAEFDAASGELTLGVDYVSEISRVVYDTDGEIIEGSKDKIETELDHWQYARVMGNPDPNWTLVATGE